MILNQTKNWMMVEYCFSIVHVESSWVMNVSFFDRGVMVLERVDKIIW